MTKRSRGKNDKIGHGWVDLEAVETRLRGKKIRDQSWMAATRLWGDDMTQIVGLACTIAELCIEDNDLGFIGGQSLCTSA